MIFATPWAIEEKSGCCGDGFYLELACGTVLSQCERWNESPRIKTVVDVEKFTCQEFGWTEEKRLELLRLRAVQKKLEIRDEILRAQAREASRDGQNIREMDADWRKQSEGRYRGGNHRR